MTFIEYALCYGTDRAKIIADLLEGLPIEMTALELEEAFTWGTDNWGLRLLFGTNDTYYSISIKKNEPPVVFTGPTDCSQKPYFGFIVDQKFFMKNNVTPSKEWGWSLDPSGRILTIFRKGASNDAR